ncbi:MAG: hypothetical protein QXF41_00440 [Candidatus Micrarchaeaceae archaeon]
MKTQSAVEYLMTYGWMFLIVATVLAAMFALGLFNPNAYAGQECLLEAGFSCTNYYMASNGLLTISIEQVTSQPINVTAIGCTENSTSIKMGTIFTPTSNQIAMPIGSSHTFNVECYDQYGNPVSLPVGSVFTGSILLNYTNTLTGFPNIMFGKIRVRVST